MRKLELTAYDILKQTYVEDISSEAYLLSHKKTGARVIVFSNDDDNKAFYIGFRTPPEDETGVPHIIEHSVLCGSRKYPVKEPFVELCKGSLNTFLNAMTYPDKTIYPLASYNDKDFKNLMDVYVDAVFYPSILEKKEIFEQEGWHYALSSKAEDITISGVVYNEMKGAFSSAYEILQREIYAALFPDNAYSKDSGGNPKDIPSLTYEQFIEFYRKYYHPSNAFIYLYGNMDVEERLDYLDKEYLSHFEKRDVDSSIIEQRGFDKVRDVRCTYPITEEEHLEDNTFLSYNKVVGGALDPKLYQAFDVLDYALVSAPGAPIRQALIDAGIGQDVYGSYDSGILQPVFSIVAKNANPEDKERFVQIVEEKLREVVKEGINKNSLLAGINSTEFRFREADYGQLPKGLVYGVQCLDSWMFDDDAPWLHVECLDTFHELREEIDHGYFEGLVEKYLLNNTHGAVVMVEPVREAGKDEKELAHKLAVMKENLSEIEISELVENTQHLLEYQELPSTEEEMKTLPMLTRDDLKKESLPLQNEELSLDGVPVVLHDLDASGIDYFTFYFEAKDVSKDEIPYLGILRSILSYVDTKKYGFMEYSNEVNIYTGGITPSLNVYPDVSNPGEVIVKFEVRTKVLHENFAKAMELIIDMLLTSDLDQTKRIMEIISETKSRLQISLSSAGHSVAAMRALSYTSKYAYYNDLNHGIEFYRAVCKMDEQIKTEPEKVTRKLKEMAQKVIARNRLLISFTGKKEFYQENEGLLKDLVNKLPGESLIGERDFTLNPVSKEGFTDASMIQYVARVGNFYKKGFEYTGCLKVLKMILSYEYLWLNVRVKGGAYGCMSAFLRTGESYFVSYRDPNLEKTMRIYEGIPQYLREFDVDDAEMTKYIIGTFGNLDTPLTPEGKGLRSMAAYLEGVTYEQIQKERDEILNTTVEQIRALAPMIEAILSDDMLCVIGNENAIKAEKEMFTKVKGLLDTE